MTWLCVGSEPSLRSNGGGWQGSRPGRLDLERAGSAHAGGVLPVRRIRRHPPAAQDVAHATGGAAAAAGAHAMTGRTWGAGAGAAEGIRQPFRSMPHGFEFVRKGQERGTVVQTEVASRTTVKSANIQPVRCVKHIATADLVHQGVPLYCGLPVDYPHRTRDYKRVYIKNRRQRGCSAMQYAGNH
jgi:hypothetical protein